MRHNPAHVLRMGLTAAAIAPASAAAGQCQITSHQGSDGKVHVEVRNQSSQRPVASVSFQPRYAYPAPGFESNGGSTVRASGLVKPNGPQTLVAEGRDRMSRM